MDKDPVNETAVEKEPALGTFAENKPKVVKSVRFIQMKATLISISV